MTTLSKALPALALMAAGLVAGCDGSGKATTDAANSGGGNTGYSPSGVVLGPLDNHCSNHDAGQRPQNIGPCVVLDRAEVPSNASACGLSFIADAGAPRTDAGTSHADAGTSHTDGAARDDASNDGGGQTATSEYGPTRYGSSADDDDCKYYISWVATPVKQNTDTYFTVTALRLEDGKPASCAGIRPDISLSLTHGVPAPRDPAPEIAPGVYNVGPIRFDAPGKWTVRFHLYEECNDSREDSPHGHAAFYVSVP